ncbi:MAG: Holliday junction resolvase RuvX [Geminicoccaceae bacterium]|nr:Holliday junction resolvase RuvX [Geminicoccaceae bacterium]MDW8368872.1 Holliday junction resolvase RuvX [Geminicoccaceae bacterium]
MPAVLDASSFATSLPPHGSLLAIDVGRRRLGLAGTDLGRRLVTPLFTISRGRWPDDLAKIRRCVEERTVVGLVVGWPLNMDGSEGAACAATRQLVEQLDAAFGLPILLQDERLTSFAVEQAIREGRLPPPKKGQPLDHYAAAVILEDALRRIYAPASA